MDAEMGERVAEQAYEFWIGPEIERCRTAGELPDDFALHGAQVIFDTAIPAAVGEMSIELRRSTPYLPFDETGNGWQPMARDLACFRGFGGRVICR